MNLQPTVSIKILLISGVLKAIHCGSPVEVNRITKDAVCFHAADFPKLVEKLQLDLHEPPMSQVRFGTIGNTGTHEITTDQLSNDPGSSPFFLPLVTDASYLFEFSSASKNLVWTLSLSQEASSCDGQAKNVSYASVELA